MIKTVYGLMGLLLISGATAVPTMLISEPAQAQGIRIDLGFGPYVWGPREYRHFKRWQREQMRQRRWLERRRWEDLRDHERREYWKWRYPHRHKRHHDRRW